MSLESLVPNLDRCKRLKELGFPQDTAFFWGEGLEEPVFLSSVEAQEFCEEYQYAFPKPVGKYAAPTTDEFLRTLPDSIGLSYRPNGVSKLRAFLHMERMTVGIGVERKAVTIFGYLTKSHSRGQCRGNENPVIAAAELWLWCAENGHLKGASNV